ncbi:MAG: hypothetical protein ACP5LR_08525 [Athalassotoga sp.]|uniref:hypothetical protein n=1 Tax=Athalassotoga sp. TaxID=2022597 RepID=UPI003D0765F3
MRIDVKRGQEVAKILLSTNSNEMPEDLLPTGVAKGSREHLMFITLTVSLDYIRDATALWRSSRETFEDQKTRYLFDPTTLSETPLEKITEDMTAHGLAQRQHKDPFYWKKIGETFHEKWKNDPRNFLYSCNLDAPTILQQLKERDNGHPLYPFLRGEKIGPLWIRMLRDNVGIELKNMDKIPIPVDTHVARATLATGVVRGRYDGNSRNLFNDIRSAWFESVKGLKVNGRSAVALDLDEPLWNLSKNGCSIHRDNATGKCEVYETCKLKNYCVTGTIVINNKAEVNT